MIGAGAMGRWCVKGLSLAGDVDEILIGDIDAAAAERLAGADGGGKAVATRVDALDESAVAGMLRGCDAVINAAQHTCVTSGMLGALKAGVPYTDLGGFFHLTRKQFDHHDAFVEAGVPAVIAMGSAPGITNILAKYGADHLDTVEEAHARCGSLDRTDWGGFDGWSIPYSLETLAGEFGSPAVQWLEGGWREVPGASGDEDCDFGPPLGVLRAYYTLHSEVATFVNTWGSQGLREATWKLALPPEFTEQMRFLTRLGATRNTPVTVDEVPVRPRSLLAALLREMPRPDDHSRRYRDPDGHRPRRDGWGARRVARTGDRPRRRAARRGGRRPRHGDPADDRRQGARPGRDRSPGRMGARAGRRRESVLRRAGEVGHHRRGDLPRASRLARGAAVVGRLRRSLSEDRRAEGTPNPFEKDGEHG